MPTTLPQRYAPVRVAMAGLLLVALVGLLDHLTGYEFSFSIFYLLPIAIVTWYGAPLGGYILCGVSAVVWLAVDFLSMHTYSHNLIPVWNSAVRLGFFLITNYLLARVKEDYLQERRSAKTDGLTGLLNATAFKEGAEEIVKVARRYNHTIALGFIDVDDFKKANDALGHAEGDHILQAIAQILRRCARDTDLVGRMGGDEFAVLLPDTNAELTQKMFARVREVLTKRIGKENWPVSISVGVAVFETVPGSAKDALLFADRLMYRVKRGGKNATLIETQTLS